MKKKLLKSCIVLVWLGLLLQSNYINAQLAIPDGNAVTIDFTGFTGAGFNPTPSSGQLDSDQWASTGFSNGDLAFGATEESGDFAKGTSSGGIFSGGIYAFEVASGNFILGIQPTGSDFTPGTITLKIQNTSGGNITSIDFSYKIYVNNDGDRGNTFNLSHSSDDTNYTDIAALNYTSTETSQGSTSWSAVDRNTTIDLSGSPIANNDFFYFKWSSGDELGSGNRDEFGLDDISITATVGSSNTAPTASNVAISGTLVEGQILTGSYDYADNENDTESGSTFKWYRSDDNSGTNKAAIGSATSLTYTLTSDDVGKYISFEVTPHDGTDAGTPVESSLQGAISAAAALSEITFTQTTSNTIGDSEIGCASPAQSEANSYYRAFDPANFGVTNDYDVKSIEFGITRLSSSAGDPTYPITVTLYSTTETFPTNYPGANYTQLATQTFNVDIPQDNTLYTAAIEASVPAGNKLLVEISNVKVTGAHFYIGNNDSGQTLDPYIQSVPCGIVSPTTFAAIGQSTFHMILNAKVVTGSVTATLTDALQTDNNTNGVVNPEDVVRYTSVVSNNTDNGVSNVAYNLTPDANSTLVVGSVTTTQGTVTTGNTSGDTNVSIDIGSLAANGGEATITFDVVANTQTSNASISAQATISGTEFTSFQSDDPDDATGSSDATVTVVNVTPSDISLNNSSILENASTSTVVGTLSSTDANGGDTHTYSLVSGDGDDDNSSFAINGSDLQSNAVFDKETKDSYTVRIQSDDGNGNTYEKSLTISITDVNEEPSFTKGSDQSLVKNSGAQTISAWATAIVDGDDGSQTLTFNVSNDNNALFSVQPAVDAATGDLTFTSDTDATGSATVTINISDDGGTANGGDDTSDDQTFTITVNDANSAPSFTKGADETILEDAGSQTISGWATSISDGDGDTQTLTFNVSNDNNSLFAVQPNVDESTGDLTYTPADNANGSATVTISLSDDGGTSNGGVDNSGDQTFTITVTAVNDEPSFTKGADETVLEDAGSQTISGWATSISDGDGDTQTLTFNVSNDNNGLFAVQPDVDETTGNLTYTPADNANGSATVTISLSDDGGTSNGGVDQSGDQTFTITVTAVNDVPSFTKGADETVLEDAGAQSVSGWATSIDEGGASDEDSQTLTFNVSNDNNGLFTVQPDVDETTGNLTYTPADNANGSVTVTISLSDDGGTSNGGVDQSGDQTFTITVTAVNDVPSFTKGADETVLEDAGAQTVSGWATSLEEGGGSDEDSQTLTFNVSNDNNSLFAVQPSLDAGGNLTYTPADDASGSATVTVNISDDGGTDNSGVDTSGDQTFTISVTAVNDIPSFTKGSDDDGLEDEGAVTLSSWVIASSAGPDNESSQTLSYTVTNDNNSLFSVQPAVDASGNLTYSTADNASGSATVTISVSDDGGTDNGGADTSSEQTFTITLTTVNDIPSFTKGSDQIVLEDAGAQTVSSWASDMSTGPSDESTQALSFNVSNDNNGLFAVQPAIDASGNLTYTPADDANGSATVTVSISDDGGTNNGGVDTSDDQTFTISVTAVNDIPSFVAGSNYDGSEDDGVVSIENWIADFSTGPDNESGQSISYNVTSDNMSLFAVQPTVNSSGTLSFTTADNANGSITVTISMNDSGGTDNGGVNISDEQTFTISLSAVNDAPSFTKGADQTVLEDAGSQTVSGWATDLSTGPLDENAQALSFNVSNGNNGLFAVQPVIDASGNLTYTLEDDANGSATVTVSVSDDGGTANGGVDTSGDQTFTITIAPVNDVPSFTKGADEAVLEDSGEHTINGWATSLSSGPSDEAGQTLSFNVSNNNNSFFAAQPSIDENGNLSYTLAAEAFGDATISVSISDDGGTADGGVDTSVDQQFVISIAPINDVPSFTKGADLTVLEDTGVNLETSRANSAVIVSGWATDLNTGPDFEEGETLTFNASNDNNTLFSVQPTVNGTNGDLMYTLANNANGSAIVTLSVSDNGGTDNGGIDTSEDQTFSIIVVAVNDAPTFNSSDDQVVNEDAGIQTVSGWAKDINTGGDDESNQTLTFNLLSNTNPDLFEVQPAIDGVTGDLTYTPKADANGETSLILNLSDDGGTDNGGDDTSVRKFLTIKVNSVNDQPSFTKGENITVNEDSGPQTYENWVTNIVLGPENESDQTVTFNIENDNNGLFEQQPVIDANGNLSFTSLANANGIAIVTVSLSDNGGTENGGVDISGEQTFMITVDSVNDIPLFTSNPDVFATEDQLYSHNVIGTDNDNDANLTITASTIPSWLTFIYNGDGKGVLSGTPGNGDVGFHSIVLAISDGIISEPITQNFEIQVANTNDAPTISSELPATVDFCPEEATETIDLSEFADDIDVGDELTYSVTMNPISGVEVDLTGSVLSITHTAKQSGSFDIEVEVRDQNTLSATASINVNVNYFDLIMKNDGNNLRVQGDGNYQWFKDGIAISGATGSEYNAVDVGIYKVTVTNGDCILESGDIILDALTSIELEDISNEVKVYPNPTEGLFNIDLPHELNESVQVIMYDIQGKVVLEQKLVSNRISIQKLPKGIYILHLFDQKNFRAVKRIVRQ